MTYGGDTNNAGWQPPPGQPPQPPSGAPPGMPPAYIPQPPYTQPPQYANPYGQQPYPPYGQPLPPQQPPPKAGNPPLRIILIVCGIIIGLLCVGVLVARNTLPRTVEVSSISFTHDVQNKKPVDDVTTFRTTDPNIHCIVRLNRTDNNVTVRTEWTAVSAVDTRTKRQLSNFYLDTIEQDASSTGLDFFLYKKAPGDTWPVGTYKVDIYVNNVLQQSGTFSVT